MSNLSLYILCSTDHCFPWTGIEQKQAGDLHTTLKNSSFVTQAQKSHKPGYRASGKALFVPVLNDAALRNLLETYFDPMTHISHYVSIPPTCLCRRRC